MLSWSLAVSPDNEVRVTELYRNDYMTVTDERGRLTLAWQREEPDDSHAVATAQAVRQALDAHLDAHEGERWSVLVDLVVVRKSFPRSTASYTAWLLGHRARVKGGAFVTKNILLRAGISAAVIVPGLTMKGFSDLGDAHVFLRKIEG